jgi:ribosomal-protein-alanine N-acetyltransferase
MPDAEAMFRNWASDPEVIRFMPYDVCDTIEDTQKRITEWMRYFEETAPNSAVFAIELKNNGEVIGTIDFAETDREARSAEVGYQLGKSWWGCGYAAEALRAVIKYCFETVGLNRLWASYDSRNPASGKVMQKAGMLYEGTLRQCKIRRGELADSVRYAILADDYFGKIKTEISVVVYERKYHDDMLFCYLSAKDAVGNYAPDQWSKPALKDDLLDIENNYLGNGDIFYLALDERDRVTGMIGTQTVSPTDLWLKRLFIKPEVKGKGIGSKLLAAVEQYAAKKGITTIHTRFANWYREAAVFYPAKGFVEVDADKHLRHMIKKLS